MSRPEFDSYREHHEDVTWKELELEFDEDSELDIDAFEFWARFEEETRVCLSQNTSQSDVALGSTAPGRTIA